MWIMQDINLQEGVLFGTDTEITAKVIFKN